MPFARRRSTISPSLIVTRLWKSSNCVSHVPNEANKPKSAEKRSVVMMVLKKITSDSLAKRWNQLKPQRKKKKKRIWQLSAETLCEATFSWFHSKSRGTLGHLRTYDFVRYRRITEMSWWRIARKIQSGWKSDISCGCYLLFEVPHYFRKKSSIYTWAGS